MRKLNVKLLSIRHFSIPTKSQELRKSQLSLKMPLILPVLTLPLWFSRGTHQMPPLMLALPTLTQLTRPLPTALLLLILPPIVLYLKSRTPQTLPLLTLLALLKNKFKTKLETIPKKLPLQFRSKPNMVIRSITKNTTRRDTTIITSTIKSICLRNHT